MFIGVRDGEGLGKSAFSTYAYGFAGVDIKSVLVLTFYNRGPHIKFCTWTRNHAKWTPEVTNNGVDW